MSDTLSLMLKKLERDVGVSFPEDVHTYLSKYREEDSRSIENLYPPYEWSSALNTPDADLLPDELRAVRHFFIIGDDSRGIKYVLCSSTENPDLIGDEVFCYGFGDDEDAEFKLRWTSLMVAYDEHDQSQDEKSFLESEANRLLGITDEDAELEDFAVEGEE